MCNNCYYYAEIATPYGVVAKCQIDNKLLSEFDKENKTYCLKKRGAEMLDKDYLCKAIKQYFITLIDKVVAKAEPWNIVDASADINNLIEEAEQKAWTKLPVKPTKTGFYFVTYLKYNGDADVEYCYLKEDGNFYMIADGDEESNQCWEEKMDTVIAWRNPPSAYAQKEEEKEQIGNYPLLNKRFTEVN